MEFYPGLKFFPPLGLVNHKTFLANLNLSTFKLKPLLQPCSTLNLVNLKPFKQFNNIQQPSTTFNNLQPPSTTFHPTPFKSIPFFHHQPVCWFRLQKRLPAMQEKQLQQQFRLLLQNALQEFRPAFPPQWNPDSYFFWQQYFL